MENPDATLFVYGTLTDPDRVRAVVEEFAFGADAALEGLSRVDCAYPTLAPGGSVPGRILRVGDVASVDRYEGVDRGLYVRVPVPRADGGTAGVYVGNPGDLGCGDRVNWPGSGEFETRVRAYVDAEDVRIR